MSDTAAIERVARAIEEAPEYDFRRVNSSYHIFCIDTGENTGEVVSSSGLAEDIVHDLNRESKARAALREIRREWGSTIPVDAGRAAVREG
jgi:hypothetical protein